MRTRNGFWSLCCLSVALLHPCLSKAQTQSGSVVAQYHFTGSTHFSTDANFAKLKQIGDLPASVDLRTVITHKFAAVLSKALVPQGDSEKATALVQPLLNDFLECESVGSFGGRPGAPLGFALAIRLDAPRAKLWETNLNQLFAIPAQKITAAEFSGLQWGVGLRGVRLVRAKDWLVVAGGDDLIVVQNQLLSSVRQQGRPSPTLQGNILEADVDWTRLTQWVPTLSSAPFKLARTQIKVGDKADNLRMTVLVHYPEVLGWKSKAWRVPTEVIREPLISFTAGQNLAVLLTPIKGVSQLQPNPLREEFFVWADGDIPFRTSAAMPVTGASNLLKSLSRQMPSLFNAQLKESQNGEIKWVSEKQEVAWQGLPLVVPFIRASSEKSGEYLVGGLFPLSPSGKPAPAELFSQINGRNNLVYYDWELTGPRLYQWRSLTQLLPILRPSVKQRLAAAKRSQLTTKPAVATKSPRAVREAWLTAVSPLLGNTITEITSTGPNDVTVIRNSHLGFTGLELVLLSHWLVN